MRPETKMANATVGKKAGDGVGWPRRATESQIRNKGQNHKIRGRLYLRDDRVQPPQWRKLRSRNADIHT